MKNKETKIIFIIIIIFMLLINTWVITANANRMNNWMKPGIPDDAELDYEPYDETNEFYAQIDQKEIIIPTDDYCIGKGKTPITHMNKDKITYKVNKDRIHNEYVEKYGELKLNTDGLWYYDVSIYDGIDGATIPYYLVAMGSHYDMGESYVVELDYEEYAYVVNVEEKSDNHTFDECQHKKDNSVVEVLTDGRNPELLNITYIWKEK